MSDKKVRMVSIAHHVYDKQALSPGDEFDAFFKDVRVLKALDRAEDAEDGVPVKAKTKNVFDTRALVASGPEDRPGKKRKRRGRDDKNDTPDMLEGEAGRYSRRDLRAET